MKNKNVWIGVVAVVCIVALALAVRGRWQMTRSPVAEVGSGKIEVTASFYPLAYFAGRIGGDKADVTDITPSGAEPHDYEPTPQDIARIEQSRIVILNGGGLEAWGDNISRNIDPSQTTIVTAGEGLTTGQVTEAGKTIIDPHVWLSPKLAKEMVNRIAASFESADPVNVETYRTNAASLENDLSDLDRAYASGLANCVKHDIITSHAAFGYLAAAYGLNQVPIAGISPDAEPSAQTLADIADFAKKNDVKYIFFESLVSPKLAQTIATEIGVQALVLDPIEGIPDGDLAAGKTYLTVMRSNLDTLETTLLCAK